MASLTPSVRSRSPRYPNHSLDQAVEFARKIYEGVHRSSVDSLTVLNLMGFSGRSGASTSALGSVRQYGLIDGVGEKTRVSDLALSILEPISESEKSDALRIASRSPAVFNQILGRFDGRLPAADAPVRSYLIRELGFSQRGAEDCLSALRTTEAYVAGFPVSDGSVGSQEVHSELEEGLDYEVARKGDAESARGARAVYEQGPDQTPRPEPGDLMVIPLSRDCRVEMKFVGPLSEKALGKLVRYVELMREDWAEE